MSKLKQAIKAAVLEWKCLGYYGYGQGRAAATFGEEELGQTVVCHDVCPKAKECRQKHCVTMDKRFPTVAEIVRRTIFEVRGKNIDPVQAIVVAMGVAANRDEPEAKRIQEGLKKFGVPVITDHYVYGQFENLDNGINKRPPDTAPTLILLSNVELK